MRKNEKHFIILVLAVVLMTFWGCSKDEDTKTEPKANEITEKVVETEKEEIKQEEPVKEEITLTESEKKVQEATEILKEHSKKNLTYAPLNDPNDEYNLNVVKNIHLIATETGEYSINKTKTNYGVGGTDLGISFNLGEKTYIAFGDTFLNECFSDRWRSNVLAVTTDSDYTNGIIFDYMVTAKGRKTAKELIPSRKVDNLEMTTIPTGGIAIGETLFMSYMSVRHWGNPGEWDCNYGSIAKSVDYGENWKTIETLRWPGDSSFCQMAPVVIDDYVYILGITGGRTGPAKMMRVPVDKYEDYNSYEYLMGYDADGNPLYQIGEKAVYEAYNVLPKAVGEMSVLYSKYLEEWLVTYIDGSANIVMRSAKNIYGPYSEPVVVVAQKDFPSLYGAFMNPKWVSEDGTKIAFMMSIFDPVYNSILMEFELEK